MNLKRENVDQRKRNILPFEIVRQIDQSSILAVAVREMEDRHIQNGNDEEKHHDEREMILTAMDHRW
jgi:hypothetical protein